MRSLELVLFDLNDEEKIRGILQFIGICGYELRQSFTLAGSNFEL